MLARAMVHEPPGDQPDQAGDPGDDEGHAPAIGDGQRGHDQRGDDRPDIGARVEQPDGIGALAGRKPFGHRLDAGREVAGFADAEAEARERELRDRIGAAMGHVRDLPDDEGDRIAEARADHVDQPAETDISDRIGELEEEDDVGKVGLGPAELGRQCRLQHADHLPIDIVDDGRRKQQADDHPAVAPGARRAAVDHVGHAALPSIMAAACVS